MRARVKVIGAKHRPWLCPDCVHRSPSRRSLPLAAGGEGCDIASRTGRDHRRLRCTGLHSPDAPFSPPPPRVAVACRAGGCADAGGAADQPLVATATGAADVHQPGRWCCGICACRAPPDAGHGRGAAPRHGRARVSSRGACARRRCACRCVRLLRAGSASVGRARAGGAMPVATAAKQTRCPDVDACMARAALAGAGRTRAAAARLRLGNARASAVLSVLACATCWRARGVLCTRWRLPRFLFR